MFIKAKYRVSQSEFTTEGTLVYKTGRAPMYSVNKVYTWCTVLSSVSQLTYIHVLLHSRWFLVVESPFFITALAHVVVLKNPSTIYFLYSLSLGTQIFTIACGVQGSRMLYGCISPEQEAKLDGSGMHQKLYHPGFCILSDVFTMMKFPNNTFPKYVAPS